MKRFCAAIALASATAAAGSAQTGEAPEALQLEGLAAVVDDQPISFFDVRQRARLLMMGLNAEPTPELLEQLAGQAREQLIDEAIQMKRAREFEVEVEDEAIASAVDEMAAASGMDRAALYGELISFGVNPRSLEDQVRADIAWQRIMSGLHGRNIRISPTRVEERLERMRVNASRTQYLISEIFLFAPDAEAKAQAREAALSILNQLNQGAPFRLAAQRFSSAVTAANGGDMGQVALEDLDPELAEVVARMGGPGFTPPIPVENGIYILEVRGRQDPQPSRTMVRLAQLVSTEGDMARLQRAIDDADGCGEELEEAADDTSGVIAVELGEVELASLSADAQAELASLEVGGHTEPAAFGDTVTATFLCNRREQVDALPSRAQIEDRLFSSELSMLSDRDLRNMRRDTTIVRR